MTNWELLYYPIDDYGIVLTGDMINNNIIPKLMRDGKISNPNEWDSYVADDVDTVGGFHGGVTKISEIGCPLWKSTDSEVYLNDDIKYINLSRAYFILAVFGGEEFKEHILDYIRETLAVAGIMDVPEDDDELFGMIRKICGIGGCN